MNRTAMPEGYLGAQARISSGPAPELVEAGYALELADAPMLHDGLHLADLAHVVGLTEQRLVPADTGTALLHALLELGEISAAEFPYDERLGDAYNSRERELTRRIGDLAGWVHFGRTRREGGRIAFRLAVRDLLVDLTAATVRLLDALAERAEETSEVLWADMTYLQPAQPSTFGHYLASFAEECARHLPRLRAAYEWVDVSPAGSGGVAGTRLALDRGRLAALLGFAQVGRNTRDTMWNLDGLVDVLTAATQVVLTADRLAEDWQILSSPGFGFVTLDASLCRASVLMPQKRNPYALSVIRAGASTMTGRLAGTVTTLRTPSASTDNWLHTYGEVTGSLGLARRLAELAAATVTTARFDAEALARSAQDEQCAATDLADELVLRTGVDYRSAYRVVGRAVAALLDEGRPLDSPGLRLAAAEVGVELGDLSQADVAAVLQPELLVATRQEPGGCSPASVRAEVAALRVQVEEASAWVSERRAHHRQARADLVALARQHVASS